MRNAKAIERLKHGQRVDVRVHPMCILLFRDGTVISMSPERNLDFTAPILTRLKHRDTSLRVSPDASFLVQALLDLIVDRVFEVVDEYQAKLIDIEHKILLRPKMNAVRDLHILQGDLNQHKRTLEPVKTVVYGLRRYDVDRVAANMSDEDKAAGKPVVGYMSHKAKIYLADVVDHMDFVLASLEMFAGTTENLINFTFNVCVSHVMLNVVADNVA
jgi:Mg2+ and Co2+ transporter CorA